MFSQYCLGVSSAAPHRAPKLSHKKSRYGCQRCRQRRVKCNEAKPVCDNCERHRATCFYDRIPPRDTSVAPSASESGSFMLPAAPFDRGTAEARVAAAIARPLGADAEDPPETRERRMNEMRLMHQYVTLTGSTVALDDKTRLLYVTLIPRLALKSDALLYCMCSLAALHLSVTGEEPVVSALDVHRRYLSMALREHNKSLANVEASNADVLCLTSSMIRVCSFTVLQERARHPYEPPVEWLMMNASTVVVVKTAFKAVNGNPQSVAYRMLNTTPVIKNEQERFCHERRRGLEHLVHRDALRDASEPWDAEIQNAYETTLSYLGGAVEAVKMRQVSEACRRLIIFPMMVKGKFIELVQERRARATVLLAHYFALLSLYKDIWWIGQAGAKEVHAAAKALTGDWHAMLEWPLDVVASGTVTPFGSPQASTEDGKD
ncbi:hypothetical protein CDD82_6722 [Ophiocordyceps australis]|uniref:Zn(2)-C6 fungal-type domain-containing protein n=1 Tax=Ophiocordyceps australis TaxID=1399860 RepID=A0A2C5YTQ9_9HYPO|nr:hypothetical protein CDD82_6722 [Ophiocordyceps australis]